MQDREMNRDISSFLVLAAGGVIFYLASRKEEFSMPDPADHTPMALADNYYVTPDNNDLYFRNLLEMGVPPVHSTIGMYGIPVYYYSRVGGRGLYRVNGLTV